VMVVAARTPNVVVLPWVIVGVAASDEAGEMKIASKGSNATAVYALILFVFFMLFRFCYVSNVRHSGFGHLPAWAPT